MSSKYPEHEKMTSVFSMDDIRIIQQFIEYLESKGYELAEFYDKDGVLRHNSIKFQDALNGFLGVDEKKLEAERKQMLKELGG